MLANHFKDPGAAQFRWMPVILRDRPEGVTDYCGLVNGKNSYGGYIGFGRFYAQLKHDDKGQFTQAYMRAVETPGEEHGIFGWMNGYCEEQGYRDFSQAAP